MLIDQSVIGWGEFELEVMRDRADNCVIVCSIENIDPMGVHTGDSVTVAPQQTLPDRLYQQLRDQAITVIRAVGVETGGSNVQFAVNPETDEILVIEMNPRVSRSSALASKATGFPIAKIAARLAVGYTLDEIPNDITKVTPASFEPTIDYVVVKWPRFAFEKFRGVDPILSTHMKSVGEIMAIGRTFQQAFGKALRSRELDSMPDVAGHSGEELLESLEQPTWDRYDRVLAAFRTGASVEDVFARCGVDRWFLRELHAFALDPDAPFAGERSFRAVDTCAAEFEAATPYFYSGWEARREDEVVLPDPPRPSVVILGAGPNRIGQGIEFDYCCVHAAMTVRESGPRRGDGQLQPGDGLDRLRHLRPALLRAADARGRARGLRDRAARGRSIVQFGGQTPLKLAAGLVEAGVPLLGTSVDAIDLAEDRGRFGGLLDELGYEAPPYAEAHSVEEALAAAGRVGFPLLVRPSYVLGGRAMEIVYSEDGLRDYLERNVRDDGRAIFLDRFLENAIEVDVDAICDGEDVWIGGIMQHVEEAGIHSGDSACVLPPHSLGPEMLETIREQAARHRARPRRRRAAQRPVRRPRRAPLRDRGQPARLAHRPVRQQGDRDPAREDGLPPDARRAASPRSACRTTRWPRRTSRSRRRCCRSTASTGADAILGPEMRSTGEVMGVARDFPTAFAKAQAAAGAPLPTSGTVFITVTDRDKPGAVGDRRRRCTTSASRSSRPAAPRRRSSAWASRPGCCRRSARARRTSSTGSRAATSRSSSTRRPARARAPTAGRSAAPRSRAACRA